MERGWSCSGHKGRPMSLATAQAFAFSLAYTLMTSIVLFRTELGGYGVLPIAEYDSAPETVVHTYDPYL